MIDKINTLKIVTCINVILNKLFRNYDSLKFKPEKSRDEKVSFDTRTFLTALPSFYHAVHDYYYS